MKPPAPRSLLLVEGDPKVAEPLVRRLEAEPWEVVRCGGAATALDAVRNRVPDLIVVDRVLPDGDGLDLCRTLREREVTTPIVVLSPLHERDECVAALDSGADDFMAIPVELNELMARVRARMRRSWAAQALYRVYADLRMDLVRRSVERGGQRIHLSNKEFQLLDFYMLAPERIRTRQEICAEVWDPSYLEKSNVLDVTMSALRKKLDRPFDSPLLHTVSGTGYVLAVRPPE